MIKLVIFDLDGTLVNAYPAVAQSVNYTLRRLGLPRRTHQEIKRSVGWGDKRLMATFVGDPLAEKAIRLYRPHHTRALACLGGVRFLAGAKGLLAALGKHGYKLAIASNRPTKFTMLILKTLGICGCFDMVLCADRAPQPKPHPDILWAILKRMRVPAQQALYVGDMGIDVECGRRAGVRTVAVSTGSSTAAELRALKPYRVIHKIAQVKTILGQQ